ncbi:MAG: hypothetical protein H7Z40_13890 [Phycisphaerae bacterium]|nr:hypothetical protein [Gemmatimonadaceae bacterium]
MPRQPVSIITRAVFLLGVIGVLPLLVSACSSDSKPPETDLTSPTGSGTGLPGDTVRNQVPNAVSGIRILPQTIRLLVNGTVSPGAYPVDERGIPSLALLAGRPTWTIRNPAIATIGADGTLRANALGTTTLFAVWNGLRDSATVAVMSTLDTVRNGGGNNGGGGDTTYTPPVPVATFNLSAYIFGRATPASPRDTANVVQMGGAAVSVYRFSADPNAPVAAGAPPVARWLVQTVTADASGKATVSNLSSGYYSVVATAMYEGNALEGNSSFAPPRTNELSVAIYLAKK